MLFLITSSAQGYLTALNNYDKFYFYHDFFDHDSNCDYYKSSDAI